MNKNTINHSTVKEARQAINSKGVYVFVVVQPTYFTKKCVRVSKSEALDLYKGIDSDQPIDGKVTQIGNRIFIG